MPHADYTTVTDRIAARLVKAALVRVAERDTRRITANGTQIVICRFARQAAKQGLLPADLDYEDGFDALFAITEAVPLRGATSTVPWTGFLPMLPDEWKHVVMAAERQLTDQWNKVRR